MVTQQCIVCGSFTMRLIAFDYGEYHRCRVCSSVSLMSSAVESGFYGPEYLAYESSSTGVLGKRKTFSYYLKLAEEYLNLDASRVLDVGCGAGVLLDVATAKGWEAVGVEISDHARRIVSERGHRVFRSVDEALLVDQKKSGYNIVCMLDVLEHVVSPLEFLNVVGRGVSPGGVLVIVTPVADSLSRSVLRRHWPHYKREHIVFMHSKVLVGALASSGFMVRHMQGNRKYVAASYLLKHMEVFSGNAFGVLSAWVGNLLKLWKVDPILQMPSGERLFIAVKS